jgi:hypothetical protein
MIILLVKKSETVKIDEDVKSLHRAMDLYLKNIKNQQQPFIIGVDGYDVFAIPGTINNIQKDGDDKIKINISEIIDAVNYEIGGML